MAERTEVKNRNERTPSFGRELEELMDRWMKNDGYTIDDIIFEFIFHIGRSISPYPDLSIRKTAVNNITKELLGSIEQDIELFEMLREAGASGAIANQLKRCQTKSYL